MLRKCAWTFFAILRLLELSGGHGGNSSRDGTSEAGLQVGGKLRARALHQHDSGRRYPNATAEQRRAKTLSQQGIDREL